MKVHLLVVCHGLWGTPAHVRYICESAARHHAHAQANGVGARASSSLGIDNHSSSSSSSGSEGIKLQVLSPETNAADKTYDGIDHCAERVVMEIDAECRRIEEEGGKVVRFSIVGYSLGGLIARYALGLLESRTPSFFSQVKPVNFTTFASPAIGIPRYDSFWSTVFRFLGARLLSRSGSQLYENDRFLVHSSFDKDAGTSGDGSACSPVKSVVEKLTRRKQKAEPLLSVMANPRYSFFKALSAFEKIDIYANTINDRTVPFPTGAIEAHDPFAQARAKAQKAADARDVDPMIPVDLREGGLDIQLAPDAAILVSWDPIPPSASNAADPSDSSTLRKTRRRRWLPRLPLLLRPTTYPFSRPVSLLIIVTLPVSLPIAFLLLVGRFILQTHSSGRRIKSLRKSTGGGRQGMLERVGVNLREVVETVGAGDNPESAAAGPDDGPDTSTSMTSSSSTSRAAAGGTLVDDASDERLATSTSGRGHKDGSGNEGGEDVGVGVGVDDGELEMDAAELRKQSRTHPAFQALSTRYDGTGTPPLSRPLGPGQPSSSSSSSLAGDDDDVNGKRHRLRRRRPALSTDPILSPAQQEMIRHLNSIPHLQKHFVYLPQSRNAHGAIVARDHVRFAQHVPGKKIVDRWAREFVL